MIAFMFTLKKAWEVIMGWRISAAKIIFCPKLIKIIRLSKNEKLKKKFVGL